MASWQARQRDPLLDSTTQAALEKRGKELLGLGLLALALVVGLVLGSYAPDDPSWMSATDEPAQNALGRVGASVASTLIIVTGLGSWGLVAILGIWGGRFVTHVGEERVLSRIVFAPIVIAVAAVFASTHVPGTGWAHSFGLGGLFGDTVLGALLGVVPVTAALGLKAISVGMGAGLILLGLFVLGFDWRELRAIGRFLLVGLIRSYAALVSVMGQAAAGTLRGARATRERLEAGRQPLAETSGRGTTSVRRASALPDEPPLRAGTLRPAPLHTDPADKDYGRGRPGLLARMRRVIDPTPEPELIEPGHYTGDLADAPSEDRIRARIADAIKARARGLGAAEPARGPRLSEPPVTATARAAAAPEAQAEGDDWDEDWDAPEEVDALSYDADAAPDWAQSAPAGLRPRVVQHPARKPPAPSRQAEAEAQPRLRLEEPAAPEYERPPLSLLTNPVEITRHHLSDEALEENARMLESVLDDYGVKGEIVSVRPGPVVTMYELEPAPGLKASRVIGLADDIARSMSALSARVSTVPGRSVIGIELPNAHREKVVLREILSARDFGDSNLRLPLALGKDISGEPVVANLAKMPHLLIAGTTGSGKSVAINTMILSLLYKLSPEECRLIMIDPKMLELSVYDGIPHLLSPVVTDPKKAVVALKWVVGEMEERYRKMSKMGVRNIEGFNGRVREALAKGEMFKRTIQTGFDEDTGEPVFETDEFAPVALPYIVVIVDEMADLMMVAGKEIEACIQRLAQMARASGIHLIMATQRPSVDVITGTIKANFPTRISFQVTSKIDSRTILGEMGAEQLLGMGDMLYMAGGSRIVRIHGPFVSDEEVEEIVTHLKSFGPPEYMSGVVEGVDDDKSDDIDLVLGLGGDGSDEALYDQAVAIVIKDRKCSTSYIQRKLAIGYNKAARLVEQMEDQGIVTPANHVGKREILVPEQ
jgi:DNA segregation ATPase FtsK/SpoIIIE, S-DNA-T family